jgi:Abnormal spindle-like microcephaly-assoc'd, ASPM-SPD-2-Hydin/NHL repeat
MKLYPLPWFSDVKGLFQHPLALLGGLLLCVGPVAAQGQSVTFTGAQSTIARELNALEGIATDSAGDLFLAEYDTGVVEFPRTATGYGPPALLPTSGLNYGANAVAVDSSGDVFVADYYYGFVAELPQAATGYGPQITLLTGGTNSFYEVAADGAGDVFVTDLGNPGFVAELPRTATGYGPQTTLFTGVVFGVAADNAGDVFFTASPNYVTELPRTPTGYGPPNYLQTSGLASTFGIAVDSAGDVFIADAGYDRVVELPKTETGSGPQTTLPISGLNQPYGAAVDNAGDLFIADSGNSRVVELQTHSVNFGGAYLCTSEQTVPLPCSQTLTLNYTVAAGGTLGVPKVLTGGAPNVDFTLASASTCTGAFSAGATCIVNVTFAPLAAGLRNGSVEIADGSGKVLTTTPICGTGVVSPVELSANPLEFGTIPFGSTSTLPLTITNIGQTSFTLAPSINGPSYTIQASTCGTGVAPNHSCTMQVEFDPVRVGLHDDTFTLMSNGSTNPAVKLTGSASGVGPTMESPLNFGNISSGTTETLPLAIYNFGVPGSPTVSFVVSDPVYQVLPGSPCVTTGVAAGQSCTLQVEFAPTSTGLHNHTIVITSSSGTVSKVELEGIAE